MSSHQTMRRLLLSAFTLLAAFPAQGQPPVRDDRRATVADTIEDLIAPQAEAELLSGVILVARGDAIEIHRAYGFANWELRVPNSLSTRFGIASITKAMTETVVDVLVREGRLNLPAPVEQYLAGFPKGPKGGLPTIGDLLSHRSGVPHRVTDAIDETQPLGPADIVERVKRVGLLFEPGTQRLYSSAGFTCLARVIEVVEKKPFERVLAERILAPSRMTSAISETGQRLMDRRAMPYRLGADRRRIVVKSAPYKDLRFLTGAGSVYATAEDLLRFVQAIQHGVFGRELSDRMFQDSPATWHSWTGRTNGYEASVDVLPNQQLIFVFLSNLQSAANWQLRERIQNILTGRDAVPVPLPPPVAEGFEDPDLLVGSYGAAEIDFVDGALFRGDNEFYPIDGRRYYIPGSGSIMRFRRDSSGRVDAILAVGPGGQETVLPRSAPR